MTAQWRQVVGTDANVAGLLGPVNTAGEDAAVRRHLEWFSSHQGLSHFWDPVLGRAWVEEANRLTSDVERARLQAAPYAAQIAATRAAWEALGRAFDALNLPWLIDPPSREAYASRTIGYDSRLWCDTQAWGTRAAAMAPGPYIGTEDNGVPCVRLWPRIFLTPANVVAGDLAAPGMTWDVIRSPGDTFTWESYAWQYECNTRTGLGDCERWVSTFFPPLVWYFDLAAEIARSLRARGPLRVLAESQRAAFVLNVRTASTAGPGGASVLASVTGPNAATSLASMSAVTVAEARMPNGEVDGVLRGIATVAGGAALIPGAGTAVAVLLGAFTGVVRLLNTLLPRAVQRDLDAWGRDRPVWELTVRSAVDASEPSAPSHDVPDPPGWTREAPPQPPPPASAGEVRVQLAPGVQDVRVSLDNGPWTPAPVTFFDAPAGRRKLGAMVGGREVPSMRVEVRAGEEVRVEVRAEGLALAASEKPAPTPPREEERPAPHPSKGAPWGAWLALVAVVGGVMVLAKGGDDGNG